MKGAKTVTHLLFPLFTGMIIGGALSENRAMWVCGGVLLLLNIIVGVSLQYKIERTDDDWRLTESTGEAMDNDDWHLSKRETEEAAQALLESMKRKMRGESVVEDDRIEKLRNEFFRKYPHLRAYAPETCRSSDWDPEDPEMIEEFDTVLTNLQNRGGVIENPSLETDEAGLLLLNVCGRMPHSLQPHMLRGLYLIAEEYLYRAPSILYACSCSAHSIGENAFVFLVRTDESGLRLFTVETHFSTFFLCEYTGNSHRNYGEVELNRVPEKIKEALDEE